MSFLKWLALIVAGIAAIIYRYHEPLPPCFDDVSLKVRIGLLSKPFIDSMAGLVEFSRLATKSQFQRGLLNLMKRRVADSAQMSSSDTIFDGVPVRVYFPAKRSPNGAALFYIHGGAWVLYDIDSYDSIVRNISLQLNVVAVSVDYRLAPEHPYPAALEDVERAYRYFVKHAADFDIDPSRIAAIGDSAGGNLATVLTIRMRDAVAVKKEKDVKVPKFQVLIYPSTQIYEYSSLSRLINMHDYILPRYLITVYRLQYVLGMDFYNWTVRHYSKRFLLDRCYHAEFREKLDKLFRDNSKGDDLRQRIMTDSDHTFLEIMRSDDIARRKFVEPQCAIKDEALYTEIEKRVAPMFDPNVSPLLTPSLAHLPPTFIVSAEVDGLRDDALLYVERLREAAVPVYHIHLAQECHGFINYGKLHKVLDALRELLAKNVALL